MKEDIPWKILEKKFKEEISAEDDNTLTYWLIHQPENVIIYNQLKSYYDIHRSLPTHFNPDTSLAINKFNETIIAETPKRRLISNWIRVAAAVFVLFLGYWFLHKTNNTNTIHYTTIAASDTAMLMHKTPDSSTIWLKARSKIRYTNNFNQDRVIYLIGEAYFEVTPDKHHPFRVFAANSVTTVVGTQFNINSWVTNKNIEITVNQGKVIFGQQKGKSVALVKGQRGVLTQSDNSLTIQTPETNYLSWLTKEFYFENAPLNTIMQKLADVYGFRFVITNKNLKETRFTARFSKRPLSEIIQTLEEVTGKQFTKTDNIYSIH